MDHLLDRLFSDSGSELAEAETTRLTQRLRENPAAARQLVESALLEVALHRVCAEPVAVTRPRKKFWRVAAAAASILILVTVAVTYWVHHTPSTQFAAKATSAPVLINGREQMEIPNGTSFEIPSGSPVTLQLTDGSIITADAGARMAVFRDHPNAREFIQFAQGAASFKITRDPHDFIIHTSTADVRVVGTQFRVAASTTSGAMRDAIRVNVSQGRVSVKTNHGEETLDAGADWSWARLADGRDGAMASGRITAITLVPRRIELDGKKTYAIADSLSATLNTKRCTLDELQPGMSADIVLAPSGNEAYAILATRP
jgi:ferric-dicitrate binding protein FerR (iron transport regulator)